ncbi:hypothetical protein WJX72_010231 [[Myrmecia] bisecta]|uniref:Protein kinase domain-containing protein n=1 Tax=[Myrmecia] bisecta TaxID=41462 RepID=A0AAW1PYG8_9CHLO
MNFSSFKQALGQAVQAGLQTATSAAKDISAQVVGAKCLREYTIGQQTCCGGASGVWKIHSARSRKEGARLSSVSVWILEKRALGEDQRTQNACLELFRKEAASLVKLKHPGVVKVLEPFEETRTQLILVTEAVQAPVAQLLRPSAGRQKLDETSLQLSELEIKHGLLQVTETLQFLHTEAGLVHRALGPDCIYITSTGAWKLAGFGHSIVTQFRSAEGQTFDFSNPHPSAYERLTLPTLRFTAPELAGSGGIARGVTAEPAADIFSFGALVYELVTHRPLLDVQDSLQDFHAKIASLHQIDFSSVPAPLLNSLRPMLSPLPATRPPASALAGAQYFQEDLLLRALRFLDTFIQRDNTQKAAFLQDLVGLWERLDARVLRYKVLPALLGELRHEVLLPLVLPLVLRGLQLQDPQEFTDRSLPELAPLCASAKGDVLLLLLRHVELLLSKMSRKDVATVIIPLLGRAADSGDARAQEEALKQVPALVQACDWSVLQADLLPRMHGLCLSTTSAAVRIRAILSLDMLAPRMNKEEAVKTLQTVAQVTSVDKSPGTTMAVVDMLGGGIANVWGVEFTAERVLPVLVPLLVIASLSPVQFAKTMGLVRNLLQQIEARRATDPQQTALPAAVPSPTGSSSVAPAAPTWDHKPPWASGAHTRVTTHRVCNEARAYRQHAGSFPAQRANGSAAHS